MARLPIISRDSLNPEGQKAYDAIAGSRGEVRGPFAMLIHHPLLAERVAAVGELLRFHSVLSGADRELAILAAGREVDALYEWAAHEPIGLKEGTRAEAIDIVRNKQATDSLTPREAMIIDAVRALYNQHQVPDNLYAKLEAEFGRQGLVELIVLAGYYGTIGFVLNTFEVELPEGVQPAFTKG
jgi:4-carboxymuconolactone decarboxylase